MTEQRLALGISGSPSATSSSLRLVERTLDLLSAHGFATDVIDLAALPAEAVVSSSTSSIMPSDLQAGRKHPGRFAVATRSTRRT